MSSLTRHGGILMADFRSGLRDRMRQNAPVSRATGFADRKVEVSDFHGVSDPEAATGYDVATTASDGANVTSEFASAITAD